MPLPRHFISHTALCAVVCCAAASVAAKTLVYVSNADSKEIYVMELDGRSGGLTLVEKVPTGGMVMPLAVSPDRRFLYASLRSAPFSVTTFAIAPDSGKLTALATVPLADNMANIATDKTGRFLLAASYGGDKISVNPIAPNGLVEATPVSVIPTGKNAHAVMTDAGNTHLLASNLGSDAMLQYKFDPATGRVEPGTPPALATVKGAGPRHFVFHPNQRWVFGSNELNGTVSAYGYNADQGTLNWLGSVSALPPGFVWKEALATADIHLTPSGKFLYATERTSNTLSAYRVDAETGGLALVGQYPTETQPRGFNIDPQGQYLLAVGQKSHALTSYRIHPDTGALTVLQHHAMGKNPNWVEIIDLP
ncbi:lactonase family protein [Rhodoferax sp. WC2427]|uniref:lactonase family protein n=1 Tax=Rhodoferax sp. WC2427 TaxID=3234144 RepID=UPI003466F033